MRVFRRRRIQDYQLRSTNDRDDSKLADDAASVPDTQLDDINSVSTVTHMHITKDQSSQLSSKSSNHGNQQCSWLWVGRGVGSEKWIGYMFMSISRQTSTDFDYQSQLLNFTFDPAQHARHAATCTVCLQSIVNIAATVITDGQCCISLRTLLMFQILVATTSCILSSQYKSVFWIHVAISHKNWMFLSYAVGWVCGHQNVCWCGVSCMHDQHGGDRTTASDDSETESSGASAAGHRYDDGRAVSMPRLWQVSGTLDLIYS